MPQRPLAPLKSKGDQMFSQVGVLMTGYALRQYGISLILKNPLSD